MLHRAIQTRIACENSRRPSLPAPRNATRAGSDFAGYARYDCLWCSLTHVEEIHEFIIEYWRSTCPYKYSFPIRTMRDWNSLPGFIVEAGILKRFMNIHYLFIIALIRIFVKKIFDFLFYIFSLWLYTVTFSFRATHRVDPLFSFPRCAFLLYFSSRHLE